MVKGIMHLVEYIKKGEMEEKKTKEVEVMEMDVEVDQQSFEEERHVM